MPENQSQAHTGGVRNPDGEPQASARLDEQASFSRPSDQDAAHAVDEGDTRDPLADTAESADAEFANLEGRSGRDPRPDYGTGTLQADKGAEQSQDRESFQGGDRSAGVEFADRMPEASSTEIGTDGKPIDR